MELGVEVAVHHINLAVPHEEVVTGDDVPHDGCVVQRSKTLLLIQEHLSALILMPNSME